MSNRPFITTLELINSPDVECLLTLEDVLKAIPSLYGVRIPDTITNVIVSVDQPGADRRDAVWFRRSSNGSFVGIYIYSSGRWVALFPPSEGKTKSVQWFAGNSNNIPPGYMIIDSDNPNFTTSEALAIVSQFVQDSTNTYFVFFACTFEGI